MNEKLYNTMKNIGAGNVALGIVALVTGLAGVVGGILTIINGARLLKRKSDILF